MHKVVKYLIIIILALTAGWLIGYYTSPQKSTEIQKVFVDKIKEKIVIDTVLVKEPVYIEKEIQDSLNLDDSLNLVSTDTSTIFVIDSLDQVVDEDIIREQLISTRNLKVEWITSDSIDVSELLNKKANSFNEEMVIEFWQSPLNLTGYELNRNKLKLFGFNPEESISLQVKDDKSELILKTSSFELRLPKTNQFKTVNL